MDQLIETDHSCHQVGLVKWTCLLTGEIDQFIETGHNHLVGLVKWTSLWKPTTVVIRWDW